VAQWASTEVGAYLRLGQNTNLDVHAAVLAFELNAIPRAEFQIAAGRDGASGSVSQAHQLADLLKAETPLQLILAASHRGGSIAGADGRERIPAGDTVIFDGYVSGVGTGQSGSDLMLTLQGTHWLADMAFASALSQSSHPTNPGEFSYRASHRVGDTGAGSYTPFRAQGLITAGTLSSDFWRDGLLPWLREVSATDAINVEELTFLGDISGGNDVTLSALDRFSTSSGNYVPLRLRMAAADADAVAEAIWNDTQSETYESFQTVTMWDKLLSFAARYCFAIVPRVNDAIVVPYVPGLRTAWKHVVRAADYDPIRTVAPLERAVRGVGVFSGLKFRTGADGREPGAAGESADRLGIGGWYSPPGDQRGLVIFREGPPWMTRIVASDRYVDWGCGGGKYPVSTTAQPDGATVPPGTKPAEPAALRTTTKRMLDRYAATLYALEHLRGRQADIVCRPRFDIAPGSTVRIERHGDRFVRAALGGQDDLSEDLFGDVVRVTHHISRNPPKFETVLTVAHVRTKSENDRPGIGLDEHPLWTSTWPGAGLIAEFD